MIGGAVAGALMRRTVDEEDFPDFRERNDAAYSEKYHRIYMWTTAAGTVAGRMIGSEPPCRSIVRNAIGAAIPTLPFAAYAGHWVVALYGLVLGIPLQSVGATLATIGQ